MIPHPPADELMAFRDGELTSPRREDVAVHVAGGETTGCEVTPLHPGGATSGYDVTRGDPRY